MGPGGSLNSNLHNSLYQSSLSCIGKASSFEEEDGTGTGRNEIRLKLSRGDLGSQFSCQAENEALQGKEPLKASVQIDVHREL